MSISTKDNSMWLQFLEEGSDLGLESAIISAVKPEFIQRSVVCPELGEVLEDEGVVLLLRNADLIREEGPRLHQSIV